MAVPRTHKGWYVGLYTDIERAVEVSGPGYTRIFVPFDVDESGLCLSNPTSASFPEATSSWGVVVGLGIHSSPTGPALLISPLDASVNVWDGTTLDFLPRNLRLDGKLIPEVVVEKVFPEPRTVWERLSEGDESS